MLIEMQLWVGPDGPLWVDGFVVARRPLGAFFTKQEIRNFPGSLPADWDLLDPDEKGEKRYVIRHTRAVKNATIAEIEAANNVDTAAATLMQSSAQATWDKWAGNGSGNGLGIDTNWGYEDLAGTFGVILVNVPDSLRFAKELDPDRRVIDHTQDPIGPKVYKPRPQRSWHLDYTQLGISPALIASWKNPGERVEVDRNATPFTMAQIRPLLT